MNLGRDFPSSVTSVDLIPSQKNITLPALKSSKKNERKILKAFLLGYLHQLFCELFQNKMQCHQNSSMECYSVDSEIIQFLIQGIIETGEYTLEGIAFHTRIPFDVIYDAACGISNHFSITLWVRIVELYMQVKPDITQALREKLVETSNKSNAAFATLLIEA